MMSEHLHNSKEAQNKKKIFQDVARLTVLCCMWYILSAGENIISKIILTDFPYPLTASISHAAFISLFLGPILKLWQVPPNPSISKRYYFAVIAPLAFGKVFASFTSQFSISKVPVSYAHTVKASMPIFTVILSRMILKEKQPWKIYFSLLPIVGGIAIATVTEISFHLMGLISALFSTLSFSLQNIFSKKTMKDKRIHHLRLLFMLCKLGVVFLLPVWLLTDVSKWPTHDIKVKSMWTLSLLFLIDCFCNFAHSMVAFTIISLVSPLSYSVANATKRIVVISMSLLTLRNPVTYVNIMGMSIAILGVLLYNKTKLDQAREKKNEILPTRSNTSLHDLVSERFTSVNLNDASLPILHVPDENRVFSEESQVYRIRDNHNHFRTHAAHHSTQNGSPPSFSTFTGAKKGNHPGYHDI
uniref:solute carrier family 35 member E1-like n=1 Tax=Styela clava TaxID=7725 RepID=UPI00193A37C6|nr:solute carrier family 35 member E1-like [Styela clava]